MTELVRYLNFTLLAAGILFVLLMIMIVVLTVIIYQQKEETDRKLEKIKYESLDEMVRQYKELDKRIRTAEIRNRDYTERNNDTDRNTYYGGSNPLD